MEEHVGSIDRHCSDPKKFVCHIPEHLYHYGSQNLLMALTTSFEGRGGAGTGSAKSVGSFTDTDAAPLLSNRNIEGVSSPSPHLPTSDSAERQLIEDMVCVL